MTSRFIIFFWLLIAAFIFIILYTTELYIFRNFNGKFLVRKDFSNNSASSSDNYDLLGWGRDNVQIFIRTTEKNFESRLVPISNTYFQIIPKIIYFVTDTNEQNHSKEAKNLIATNCENSHNRVGLCCKLEHALLVFLLSNKNWMCHLDDDTYLQPGRLLSMLRSTSYLNDFYVGKISSTHPFVSLRNRMFQFGTGGAGYCLSRSLSLKLYPYVRNGGFQATCQRLKLPDDCVLGYLITNTLQVKMTSDPRFHSHLENIPLKEFKRSTHWITCSYSPKKNDKHLYNWMYEIHCHLHPEMSICRTYSIQ